MAATSSILQLLKLDRNLCGLAATRDAGDPYSENIRQRLDAERQAVISRMTPEELVDYELERHRVRQIGQG